MTFGEKLKQLRTEKGITQNELAEKLYVTFQTVSKWENNVNQPDIPTLKQIAHIFNCSVDYLLDIDSKNNNQHNQPQQDVNIFPAGIQNRSQETTSQVSVERPNIVSADSTIEKPKEAKPLLKEKGKHRLSNRDDKVLLIWGIVIGVIAIIAVIVISAVTGNFSGATIGIAIGVGYTATATIYCIFSASYISDVFLEISSWTIKFPGLIFSWDLEGFVWLIGMKIFFAVLGFLIGVAVTILAVGVSALLSIFSFVPVLISNRRESY